MCQESKYYQSNTFFEDQDIDSGHFEVSQGNFWSSKNNFNLKSGNLNLTKTKAKL